MAAVTVQSQGDSIWGENWGTVVGVTQLEDPENCDDGDSSSGVDGADNGGSESEEQGDGYDSDLFDEDDSGDE